MTYGSEKRKFIWAFEEIRKDAIASALNRQED